MFFFPANHWKSREWFANKHGQDLQLQRICNLQTSDQLHAIFGLGCSVHVVLFSNRLTPDQRCVCYVNEIFLGQLSYFQVQILRRQTRTGQHVSLFTCRDVLSLSLSLSLSQVEETEHLTFPHPMMFSLRKKTPSF